MRIGLFQSRLPEPGRKPGGAEVYVQRLARALATGGHEVTVLTYAHGPQREPYEVRLLRPHRVGTSPLLRQYAVAPALNLRRMPYDVLHLFGDDWFYTRRTLPTVRTLLGSAAFEAATATSLKRRVDQHLLFVLEQRAARLADAAYGIGPDSAVLGGRDGMLLTGADGLGEPVRAPHPAILFVGTQGGRKRGHFALELFAEYVLPRVPSAELWMVTDQPVDGPGVRTFVGVSDEVLAALYASAWAFLLPSRYEGLGMPYLEAMNNGLPVVASPNPAAQMMLDGVTGTVRDAEMGQRLVELLTNAARRKEEGRRGRARALEFLWTQIVEDHEAAYALAGDRFRTAARWDTGRWARICSRR